MTITWIGHACFLITAKDVTIFTDPFDKKIGLLPPRGAADIVTISHEHYDHNNRQALASGNPFVIDCPGEYDVKGVFVKGIPSFHDKVQGAERGVNTIYIIEVEGIRVAHFGDFGQGELTDEQREELNGVDIVFLPVGGVYTVDAHDAAKVLGQIEPKIVIPMHYAIPSLAIKLNRVDDFLKEMGDKIETIEKLSIKKKDFTEENTRVVVLTPQRS